MTFEPVVPPVVLAGVAVAVMAIRAVALRQALRQAGAGHRVTAVLRWSGLTLAMLLLLLAVARPALPTDRRAASAVAVAAGSDVNVFFVVDRSVDSRVEDFDGHRPRMAGIRSDIATLIDRYSSGRFAMISFSTRASMDWPLSGDVWSLKPMIAGLTAADPASPDAMYDVDPTAASDLLRYKLYQGEQQYPHAENLVFYFGEGAPRSPAPHGGFDLGSAKVTGGAVLGYGARGGAPASSVNEAALTAVGDALRVPYVHRDNSHDAIPPTPAPSATSANHATDAAEPTELYWAFTLPAAALILIEIYLVVRQFRRDRLARTDVAP